MPLKPLKIVIFGLSITSSWGNGHATTYRSLVRELVKRGHKVLFLERDTPWYSANRDIPGPGYGRIELYTGIKDLKERFSACVEEADFVMIGSYVPQGAVLGRWITDVASGATAFYDIDTPVTLSRLKNGGTEYLSAELIQRFSIYLSFTGGPILKRIERDYGSPMARPLYCSVDPEIYSPVRLKKKWDLGYIGTYSTDRQPPLERLMLGPARSLKDMKFIVAGPLYPEGIEWPENTERVDHLPPMEHRHFYNSMRFTMNITRADMVRAGFSPSVRLFEAAACGTPIITDYWKGLPMFFEPGEEILISGSPEDTMLFIKELPEEERLKIGMRARARVLMRHTASHRVDELEDYLREVVRPRCKRSVECIEEGAKNI